MDVAKLKEQLQTEVDTAFLYDSIAAIQSDENLSRVLRSLSDIEKNHAKQEENINPEKNTKSEGKTKQELLKGDDLGAVYPVTKHCDPLKQSMTGPVNYYFN